MLNKVSLFSALSPEELQILEGRTHLKKYRKNTIIIERGGESAALFILVSGKVRVYIPDDDGKEVVLKVCSEPGSYFGELSLLGNTARTASVITLENSSLKVIFKQDFLNCFSDNPQIALDIIGNLVEQVTKLTDRLSAFALKDVYGRLVVTLNELAKEKDGRFVTQRVTQQELAQMIGASREMISRIFRELQAGDYIRIEEKRIVLNKKLPARW